MYGFEDIRHLLLPAALLLSLAQGYSTRAAPNTPDLPNDNSLFPQPDTDFWVNPNSTAPLRISGSGDAFPMAECHGFALEEATIDQMQAWMGSGKLTSRQLVLCYLDRILQLNEYVK